MTPEASFDQAEPRSLAKSPVGSGGGRSRLAQ